MIPRCCGCADIRRDNGRWGPATGADLLAIAGGAEVTDTYCPPCLQAVKDEMKDAVEEELNNGSH